MAFRPIRGLRTRVSVRQLDARETGGGRIFAYLLVTGAAIWGGLLLVEGQGFTGVSAFLALFALLNLVLFRPWLLTFHLDLDTEECRVDLRLFGVLPLWVRRRGFAGRRFLTVEHQGAEAGEEISAVGCLAMVLPFPLSLLVLPFDGGDPRTQDYWVVALQHALAPDLEELLRVRDRAVAEQLLAAIAELLPDQVG